MFILQVDLHDRNSLLACLSMLALAAGEGEYAQVILSPKARLPVQSLGRVAQLAKHNGPGDDRTN